MATSEMQTTRYMLLAHVVTFFLLLIVQNELPQWKTLSRNRTSSFSLASRRKAFLQEGTTTAAIVAKCKTHRLSLCLVGITVCLLFLVYVDSPEGLGGSVPLRTWVNLAQWIVHDTFIGHQLDTEYEHETDAESQYVEGNLEPPTFPYHTQVAPTISFNDMQNKTKNVVIIVLESTRPDFCTPYHETSHKVFFGPTKRRNPDIQVTPFLNRLSKHAIRARNAYTAASYTVKALGIPA